MTTITTKRHPIKFYTVLTFAFLFLCGLGTMTMYLSIDILQKGHPSGKEYLMPVLSLGIYFFAFALLYSYLKNSPKIEIDKDTIKIGKQTYLLNEVKDVALTGKMPFGFIIKFPMEGTALLFNDGTEKIFFDDMYSNSWELKSFLEQTIIKKQEFKHGETRDTDNDEVLFDTETIFKGNQFTSLRGISLWGVLGFLAFMLISKWNNPPIVMLIFFGIFGTGWLVLHGWLMHYFGLAGEYLIIRNHVFLWKAKVYRLSNIKEVVFETQGKQPNCMRIITNDFKNKMYPAGTLRDIHWLLMKRELEVKGITVRNECIPESADLPVLPDIKVSEKKIPEFLSIFIPREGFIITPVLLYINILIFLLMALNGINILSPEGESLIRWGANFRPSTLEGQWWRLLSNCFLHIGIFHLLMNMYALMYIGLLLEPILGKSRYFSAYLYTGLAASTTSLLWHPLTISAGASGAIFGLYGVFLSLLTTDIIERTSRKALLTSIAVFVGYNLLYGMKAGIDNAAHVGGLISGLIIGYSFLPSLREEEDLEIRYRTIILLCIPVILFMVISLKVLPNDFARYDALMEEFSKTEKRALHIQNLQPNAFKEEVLYEIKNRGIYYWNECIKLLNEAQKCKIPSQLQERNSKLLEYCQLRIKSLELTYTAVEQESPMYQVQIDKYNIQIENIIKDLSGE